MNSPYVDRDSHVAALIRSRQAVEADPGDVAAHFNQALALCQLGQWEQAIAAWEHVVQREPDNAFAYVNMGIVYLEQAQWERAEQAFTQAVCCRADHAAAHFGLGLTRAQQGQREAARDAWKETLRLDPDHAEAKYNLDFLAALPPESLPGERTEDTPTDSPSALSALSNSLSTSLSSNMAYTAQVEYAITSQINMLPVMENADAPPAEKAPAENAKAPAENRIKLPPLSGPPLDSIVQSVIAAQQDTLTEQVGAATGQTQNAEEREPAQAKVEPTLRMDGKELKKEHRKMRRLEASANDDPTGKWSQSKWMTGGAVVLLALLLIAWGAWGMRRQSTNVPSSGSPELPVTSASLSSGDKSPLPPPVASTTAFSGQSGPSLTEQPRDVTADSSTLSGTTPANKPPSSGDADIPAIQSVKSAVKPKPAPKRAAVTVNDAPATIRAYGAPRQRAEAAAVNHSERTAETQHKPREAQTTRPHPATTTHQAAFHDEDTFPTHSRTGHGDNSEEWTDKIP